MKKLCVILLALLAVIGCSKPYVITTPLSDSTFPSPAPILVGTIQDALPADMDPADRPTAEAIEELKGEILEKLVDEEVASTGFSGGPKYRVEGSIINYSKGSGFVRFMFGMGLGSSKLVIQLKLIDATTGAEVFGGNFTGAVSSGWEKGNKMFERIAKDFAKQIKKQREKLLKG